MRMTNTQLKRIAQGALRSKYGFYPEKLAKITLLECQTDGTYIRFKVEDHEYSFNSYICSFGGVWVGPDTVEKIS